MRRLAVVAALVAVTLFVVSCGSDSSSSDSETATQPHKSAHVVPPEIQQKVVDDARQDLDIIIASGADTSLLPTALTGAALKDAQAQDAQDLTAGKYRKHDYQNINLRFQDFALPYAEVFVEFDDYGYYVSTATGAAIDQPTKEHKSYALALVEEGNRWKIQQILSPSAASQSTPSGQS